MEWKVAPSYQGWTIEQVDEENRKAYVSTKCWKCGGSGQYAWFGTCFRCGGAGKEAKWVKAYTPEQYEKYIIAQKKAKEKRVQKELDRQQELRDKSEENKKALLEKFGFDAENPKVYLVAGGNTYDIKDELKERGGRYNPAFNWYFTKETEVPEGFKLVPIDFDDVYNWLPLVKKIELKEEAKKVAEAARAEEATESKSEFVGDIKQRLRDLKVTLSGARAVSSAYGESIMFTFEHETDILVWFTTNPPDDFVIGKEYLLTGTVKKHSIYNGIKQTYLSRCILKNFG